MKDMDTPIKNIETAYKLIKYYNSED